MQFANVGNLTRIGATPGLKGTCPSCGAAVIAKCGHVNVWHWAHVDLNCPFEREPETQWHRNWKSIFPADWCEVPIGSLRADVRTSRGVVIEFQNSPISYDEILKREAGYGKMAWVLNGRDFQDRFSINPRGVSKYDGSVYSSYRWLHRKKYAELMRRPVFIDFDFSDDYMFRIKKSRGKHGWGNSGTKSEFVDMMAGFRVPWNLIYKEYFNSSSQPVYR